MIGERSSGIFIASTPDRNPKMMIVASSRLVAAARYGGNTRDARRSGGAADPNAESEWMDKARKLANQRAARFRQERGAQPVAPGGLAPQAKAEEGRRL